jgi:hypothetical protein
MHGPMKVRCTFIFGMYLLKQVRREYLTDLEIYIKVKCP